MYRSANNTPANNARLKIEETVVRRLVRDLLHADYQLAVDDGGDSLAVHRTNDSAALINALMNTDEDYLVVYVHEGTTSPTISNSGWAKRGWVRLVYGNDGWDVICDYTTNLEAVIEPITEWADQTYCN